MSKKQRSIVMNGNLWGTYDLSFTTYLRLLFIRWYLWGVRWLRRINRGVKYCKYALLVVPFWAIYAAFVFWWGTQRDGSYPFSEILWDMKSSLFSSVILAAITAFITQYSKNKYSYLEQHRVYLSIMHDSSVLYKDFLTLLCGDLSKEYVPFWPFYTKELVDTVRKQFEKTQKIDKESEAYRHVVASIANLRRSLEYLERYQFRGTLAECSVVKANTLIAECQNSLTNLERQLDSDKQYKYWGNILSSSSKVFYELIELLRLPWRRDLKLRIASLKMIYQEDESIANVFYNAAFLEVIDYSFYENLDEYIEKLRKQVNPK